MFGLKTIEYNASDSKHYHRISTLSYMKLRREYLYGLFLVDWALRELGLSHQGYSMWQNRNEFVEGFWQAQACATQPSVE